MAVNNPNKTTTQQFKLSCIISAHSSTSGFGALIHFSRATTASRDGRWCLHKLLLLSSRDDGDQRSSRSASHELGPLKRSKYQQISSTIFYHTLTYTSSLGEDGVQAAHRARPAQPLSSIASSVLRTWCSISLCAYMELLRRS